MHNSMNNHTADDKSRILKERARKFAAEVKAPYSGEEIEVLEFMLDSERYGIETVFIREVYPLYSFTKIPCTPDFVTGVMNIRGEIISIIDVGKFFELPRKGITDLNRVIVLHSNDLEFGILADEINGVKRIPSDNVGISVVTLTDLRSEYLKGITGDRLIILDGEKLLSDSKLLINDVI